MGIPAAQRGSVPPLICSDVIEINGVCARAISQADKLYPLTVSQELNHES